MAGPSPAAQNAEAGGRPPRMVRLRTAIIAGVVGLLIGIGIGGAARGPEAPPTTGVAAGSQAPAITPAMSIELTPGPTAEPTAQPTPIPTPIPVEPVVVNGSGRQNTKPFDMPGGDFTVVIAGSGEGNVIVDLIPRGGSAFDGDNLYNEISHGKYQYETVVYGLSSGSYYLAASVDGPWVVTFTPLP
jgi:hypothetical protein